MPTHYVLQSFLPFYLVVLKSDLCCIHGLLKVVHLKFLLKI